MITLNQVKIPNGIVLFEGSSRINGKPIVVIATGLNETSGNVKTGAMVQTWILHSEMNPLQAHDQGEDDAICGDCIHRHGRSCYVNIGIGGPSAVYKAYKRGIYPKVSLEDMPQYFKDRNVRLGSYGDPVAVDISVWDAVLKLAHKHTGYTHQHRKIQHKAYQKYLMASCETADQANKALSNGWKPFYVRQADDALPAGMFVCPASKEGGNKRTCETCMACHGGTWNGKQATPTIILHGPTWKVGKFQKVLKAMKNKKKIVGLGWINKSHKVAK